VLDIKYNGSYPGGIPYVSIAMSTYHKGTFLRRTLASIRSNKTSIPYEIIVVDDGSVSKDRHFHLDVCCEYSAQYVFIDGGTYRNPAVARNIACRQSRGEILIMQSDDVMHTQTDTIDRLADLERGNVKFATVYNVSDEQPNTLYVGKDYQRPFFFLGSIYKDDFWKIGGNDEDFIAPGYEDELLGEHIKRNYKMEFCDDVVGHHQSHQRPLNLGALVYPSRVLFEAKMKELNEKGTDIS
jgi:cellulose synthase/poly-beta-1,6-N-acetylglucosamine synthase-like glycosyltransferase